MRKLVLFAAVAACITGTVLAASRFWSAPSDSSSGPTPRSQEGGAVARTSAEASGAPKIERTTPPVAESKPVAKDAKTFAGPGSPISTDAGAEPKLAERPAKRSFDLPSIREMIAAGKKFEAREALAEVYGRNETTTAQRDEMEPEMTSLGQSLWKTPPEGDFEWYTIQQGDKLMRIAEKYRVEKKIPVEFGQIKFYSGLKGNLISVGSKLRIPKGRFQVIVRKSSFKLHLLYQGAIVKTYRCGLGKDDSTPCGRFTVSTKTPKPTWWPPENIGIKGPVGPDDPRNPLGSHWIGLEHDLHRGLGIHGTNEPGSIGSNSSMGCVRLSNEDVKELFEIVSKGSEVTILP